jgi:hypothetical protein
MQVLHINQPNSLMKGYDYLQFSTAAGKPNESGHNLDPGGYRGKQRYVNGTSDNEEKIALPPGRARPAKMSTGTQTDATGRRWPEDADWFVRSVRMERCLERRELVAQERFRDDIDGTFEME